MKSKFHVTFGGLTTGADDKSNFVKNVKILEFHDHIWNHHAKYIEISTNIPAIDKKIESISGLNF